MSSTRDFFDELAPRWDSFERANIGLAINTILDRAEVGPDDTILDVGCGTGVLVPFLEARGLKSYTGLDFSAGMAAVFSRKFPGRRIVVADYQTAGLFPNRSFSKIMIYNSFPHFERRRSVFKNSFAYLRRSGSLFIAHSMNRVALDSHHRDSGAIVRDHILPSDEQFTRLYRRGGFRNILVEDGTYFYSCGRKP